MPRKPSSIPADDAASNAKAQAALLEQQIQVAQRLVRLGRARSSLLDFTRITMPDVEEPDNIEKSRYQAVRHHEVIAASLEAVDRGEILRLIITMPPRHGKSELASKRFPAWFMGRDPYRQLILSTYNETFAEDFGREVRNIMQFGAFTQVFPGATLRKGSAAANRLQTDSGGIAAFTGVGGAITGRGADLLVIDDPIKDREEAESKTSRDKLWSWFTDVAMTRLMPGGRVVIVMTRWHEDDLVGRLLDPKNPFYKAEEAAQWKVLQLPALAERDDPMDRKPGEALWPDRYPEKYLQEIRRLNPRGFASLYQGHPSPEEGTFFKRDWLKPYNPNELPRSLRMYAASDHAVSTKQDRDLTCLVPFGVCENGHIWVMPDVWWRQAETDDVVDAMLVIMRKYKPLMWFAESGHISKSLGPFLRKRMLEESVFCAINEIVPVKDKQTRAQSIRGRMAMGCVHLPDFATWHQDAVDQVLKFPAGTHDDFVDGLALCGLGMDTQVGAASPKAPKPEAAVGTLAWVKDDARYRERRKMFQIASGGF